MWRILNQNKTEIISNIYKINIDIDFAIKDRAYRIFAWGLNNEDNPIFLGAYSTKERARQVLIAALHMEHFEMPADGE